MIDTGMVEQMIRAGHIPAQWQVLRARTRYFLLPALGRFALALVVVVIAVVLLLTGTVYGYGLTDTSPQGVVMFWFFVDMAILALWFLVAVVSGVRRLIALARANGQFLVLMPEGFVLRRGFGPDDLWTFNYPNVHSVAWTYRRGVAQMTFRSIKDTRVAHFNLDSRFGPPKRLAQQIQAMHTQYAQHVAARAHAGYGY